ncbi:Arm DNA-binding domain-containing protein [Mucilaginibacter sp. E4BP6]
MISSACLNFTLKKSKVLANGTAPIYIRLTVEGDSSSRSTVRSTKLTR